MLTPQRRKQRNTALSFGVGVGGGALLGRRRRFSVSKAQDAVAASGGKATSWLRGKIGGYSERLGAYAATRVKARRPPIPLPTTRMGRAAHYVKNSRFGRYAIRKGVNLSTGLGAKIMRTRAARRFMADLIR